MGVNIDSLRTYAVRLGAGSYVDDIVQSTMMRVFLAAPRRPIAYAMTVTRHMIVDLHKSGYYKYEVMVDYQELDDLGDTLLEDDSLGPEAMIETIAMQDILNTATKQDA